MGDLGVYALQSVFSAYVTLAAMIVVVAAVVVVLLLRKRSGSGTGAGNLADGAVVLIADGQARALTDEAADLLSISQDAPVAPALAALFGGEGGQVVSALEAAERTGEPHDMLVPDASGRMMHLRLRPVGTCIRLSLTDLTGVARPAGADPPPVAAEDAVFPDLAHAPILLWRRDAQGRLQATQGRIGAEAGWVHGAEAARLLTQGGGQPEPAEAARFRLQVPLGEAQVPLHGVEVGAADGGRIGFATDASDTQEAERTLSRFVQTMTEIFAHLTVGLAIFDRDHRLALFNPAMGRMWQLDPVWLAQRPTLREILDALRSNRRIPEFRDYHAWRASLTGLLDDPERADYEELWTLSDGSSLRALARPHPHGSLAFIFDNVTEQVRLEQRHRHVNDLFRSTLDRLHEGIVVFSPDGLLRYVNAAFHDIWDTDGETVAKDMHVRDVVRLTHRLSLDTDVWERVVPFATGEAARRPWTARITLGSGRMLGARFAPMPDGSTMAVFADVTDSERVAVALHERNEALEAAEQMRTAVLDQISHRLRTPLNTVFGFGELLASPRTGPLNAQQSEYAAGILEGAAQLLDTVSEVTDLASLQIDPTEGEETGQSVEDVFALTCSLLERRSEESGVRLVVDLPEPVGIVGCTGLRLRQIVFNLVADAIHRCPEGGEVVLEGWREPDGSVCIATREPAAATDAEAVSGLELNTLTLSLVRRLVADLGGSLDFGAASARGTFTVSCRLPEPQTMATSAAQAG